MAIRKTFIGLGLSLATSLINRMVVMMIMMMTTTTTMTMMMTMMMMMKSHGLSS